jgi:hypothetical protein
MSFLAKKLLTKNPSSVVDPLIWNQATLPGANADWREIAYGNGRFVIIAYNSTRAMWSNDGITWAETTMPGTATTWVSVVYGGNRFIAIAESNRTAYSTDGISWVEGTSLPAAFSSSTNKKILYGDGVFVVFETWNNQVKYSLNNGSTWSSVITPGDDLLWIAGYGETGRFLGINNNTSREIIYSDDGISWNLSGLISTLPYASPIHNIVYGNNLFLIIATTFSRVYSLYSSNNGDTWTTVEQNSSISSGDYKALSYGNGLFAALRYSSNEYIYSLNGHQWNKSNLPSVNNWISTCYEEGKFVSVAQNSNSVIYTSLKNPLINWQLGLLPSSSAWSSIAYGAGKFVVASSSTNVIYSEDGINWNTSTLPFSVKNITYGNGVFVAVYSIGAATQGLYSSDGINWNIFTHTLPRASGVVYGDGRFIVTSGGGNQISYSDNLINWTVVTLPVTSGSIRDITFGEGVFCIASNNTASIFVSTDKGVTWTSSSAGHTSLERIIYGKGMFVATQQESSRRITYSENGINWTSLSTALPEFGAWKLLYSEGIFIAMNSNTDKGAYSYDGITWNAFTLPVSLNWSDLTSGEGKAIAMASGSSTFLYTN